MSLLANHGLLGQGILAVDQSVLGSNTNTDHILIFPATPKPGSIMTAFYSFGASSVSVTIPSGWTELQTVGGGGSNSPISRAYYKIAGASESNSYNFSTALSIPVEWAGINLVNANSVDPIGANAANTSGATNVTSLVSNNLPITAGSIVLAMYASGGPSTSSTNGYASIVQSGTFGVHSKSYPAAQTQNTTFSWVTTSRARTISVEILR